MNFSFIFRIQHHNVGVSPRIENTFDLAVFITVSQSAFAIFRFPNRKEANAFGVLPICGILLISQQDAEQFHPFRTA